MNCEQTFNPWIEGFARYTLGHRPPLRFPVTWEMLTYIFCLSIRNVILKSRQFPRIHEEPCYKLISVWIWRNIILQSILPHVWKWGICHEFNLCVYDKQAYPDLISIQIILAINQSCYCDKMAENINFIYRRLHQANDKCIILVFDKTIIGFW